MMSNFYDFRKHIGHSLHITAYGHEGLKMDEKHIPESVGFGTDPVKQIKLQCLTCDETIETAENANLPNLHHYFLHSCDE